MDGVSAFLLEFSIENGFILYLSWISTQKEKKMDNA